jgi:hypothetical protein
MENLEEHIRNNRKYLDRYNPPSDTWKKIEKELKKDKRPNRNWILVAAMIAVIFGTAVILFRPVYRWSDNKKYTGHAAGENSQLKETEIYYNNLVNSLYEEATPLLTNIPDVKKELNSDLSHLDSICTDLKRDLKDNISNQDVMEALIRNYRIKIQILEDMVTVLKENENNTEKKSSHEL